MKRKLRLWMTMLLMAVMGSAWAEEFKDVLNQSFTGVTGTNYAEWSGKTSNSEAVYAGQSAGGNESIQLRSSNSNSGIVTTASGGKVKNITVTWNSNTASGRTLNVYGKNTPYMAATDLFNSSNQGELLGTIVCGTSTELNITGDYEFIGLRSASGAMYLTEIDITWSTSPKVETPVFNPSEGTYNEPITVTISSATNGATIYYTTDGTEPTTSSTPYTEAISVTETTTIKAIAVYGEMDNSEVATATYIIKVPIEGVFVKATSENELANGMKVIIVNEDYNHVMGEQRTNNFGVADVTIDTEANPWEATLEDEDNTTILTLIGEPGAWYFMDENGKYLYAASSSSNYLRTQDEQDDNAKAEIRISGDNSNATITFQGTNSHNIVMYNNSNNPHLFSCYESTSTTMKPVQIYYLTQQSILARPTITPASGTYTEPQTVTITNNAEGTTLYYTTDETTPTSESTRYTSSFVLGKNGTYIVKAVSIGADGSSRVTTSIIVIDITVDAPVFTEASGTTFDAPYTIHLTSAEGTTIYYTTGSAIPIDEDGNLTSSAIAYPSTGITNLSNAMTINAIAIDQWGNVSTIATALYKYIGEVTLPYYENFDEGLGNFVTYPQNTGSVPVQWEYTVTNQADTYGEVRKYARIKGGTTSATSTNSYTRFIGSDYLVSPVIDMQNENLAHATLNFVHGGHYFGSGYDTNDDGTDNLDAKKASCKLYVRNVTDGVPTDITSGWIDITEEIQHWFYQQRSPISTETNNVGQFPRVGSGDISLDDYVGKKIQIAFYFTTDATKAGYWNVLRFAVTGTEAEKENYEEVEMSTDGYITYVVQNDIDWEGMRAKDKNADEIPVYGYKVIEYSMKEKLAVLVELGLGGDDTSAPTYSEKIIPAETPIVIKGKGKPWKNKLLIAKSDDVIPSVKGNLLRPSYGEVAPTADQQFYVLQKQDGWNEQYPYDKYWFNRLKTGRLIPNRKAYLNGIDMVDELQYANNTPDPEGPLDPAVPAAFIILRPEPSAMVSDDAGIVDGVETIESNRMGDNEFYTISGVRVNHPTKGLYIMNGKKVIIK